jgi:hypothetical protein
MRRGLDLAHFSRAISSQNFSTWVGLAYTALVRREEAHARGRANKGAYLRELAGLRGHHEIYIVPVYNRILAEARIHQLWAAYSLQGMGSRPSLT